MTKKIVALAGDGIGPEIMEAGLSVLKAVAEITNFDYSVIFHPSRLFFHPNYVFG